MLVHAILDVIIGGSEISVASFIIIDPRPQVGDIKKKLTLNETIVKHT